jgi:very-short-patch-repair endonuclease
MNDLLATLSATHFGAFTTHDAYDCGYHRQSLSQLVRRGWALRLGPSAYVDRARYEAASPERRHEMATRAVVRTFDGRVYASHYSALTLMSLPVFGAPLEHIHVARVADSLSRRRPGLFIHTTYGPSAGCLIGRTPSVTPALAILGAAMACGIETGVVAADAALAAGKTTPQDLQTWLGRLSRHRDVTHAREAVRLADARSESVGESRTRMLLNAIGFRPTPQVEIRDLQGRLVGRVDFLMEQARIVVEFDGLMKYADAHGREALAAEKSREDRLRALGYEFVRLTWADLSRPAMVERQMRLALVRASARRAGR